MNESPKRRWFRFSLRTMFVVVTVFAVGLAIQVRSANRQKGAVDVIVAEGGRVSYSYQYDSAGRFMKNALPPGPDWLRRAVGEHFFITVQSLSFPHGSATTYNMPGGPVVTSIERKPVSDAALACLKDLPGVAKIDLQLVDVGDDRLSYLTCLKQLRILYLNGTRVTDVGLEQLKTLTNLKQLDLRENEISDQGARRIVEALPKTKVSIRRTRRSESEPTREDVAPL